MKTPEDKEKLVRDLVNTFNDRDEIHMAYKSKMKGIFLDFFCCIISNFDNTNDEDITPGMLVSFIDSYVEERFRPEK